MRTHAFVSDVHSYAFALRAFNSFAAIVDICICISLDALCMQVDFVSPIIIRSLAAVGSSACCYARVCVQFIGTVPAFYTSLVTFND